jgi:hypothetical protein
VPVEGDCSCGASLSCGVGDDGSGYYEASLSFGDNVSGCCGASCSV